MTKLAHWGRFGTDSTYKLELSGLNIATIPFPVSTKVLFVCTDKSIFALLSKVRFQSILKTLITKILKLVTVCVWKYNTGLLFQVVKKVFATTNNRAVDIDNWKIGIGGMTSIQNIFSHLKRHCAINISLFCKTKRKALLFKKSICNLRRILWKFLMRWLP